MPKLHFGHCIGCDQPIRPPYLSFKVMHVHGDGNSITEWEEVDTCSKCQGTLTAEDLHRLVTMPDEEEITESQRGADDRRRGFIPFTSPPPSSEAQHG